MEGMSYSQYRDVISGLGIAVEDAEVLADCMVTKKVCFWINTAHSCDVVWHNLFRLY